MSSSELKPEDFGLESLGGVTGSFLALGLGFGVGGGVGGRSNMCAACCSRRKLGMPRFFSPSLTGDACNSLGMGWASCSVSSKLGKVATPARGWAARPAIRKPAAAGTIGAPTGRSAKLMFKSSGNKKYKPNHYLLVPLLLQEGRRPLRKPIAAGAP